ncbi:MAG: hypothetical protein JSV53_05255 [candidate division WOR-3 bacterium]|nr:MAG: hypothetical protein JSV53_05255 [candidate division WOR-3 bacterium]
MDKRLLIIGIILIFALVAINCAPGNERWTWDHQAGFWAGIWHGIIIIITFIVSLFTRDVGIYEFNNNGWPYNIGFLIGLCFSIGAPWRWNPWKWGRKHRMKKKEWDEIGAKVEEKVREGLKAWLQETKKKEREEEWDEIAQKIEEKIKKSLKEWAEK